MPLCRLIELGDSTGNLELRIWINDAKNGLAKTGADVLFRLDGKDTGGL